MIDTAGEYLGYAALVLIVGIFLGGVLFLTVPNLDLRVRYALQEDPEYVNGSIKFTRDQVEELNRLYDDRLEEYAFCLSINQDGRVTDLRHPLRDHESTESSISVECPASSNGLLHTHPGPGGVPELSETDKVTLARFFEVSCILAGTVPGYETRRPVALNCFQNPFREDELSGGEEVEGAGFPRIEVQIQS